jgi:hypothetical protein
VLTVKPVEADALRLVAETESPLGVCEIRAYR